MYRGVSIPILKLREIVVLLTICVNRKGPIINEVKRKGSYVMHVENSQLTGKRSTNPGPSART